MVATEHQPADLTIDRSQGTLTVAWTDGHRSTYRLAWLRNVCPCASCREERRQSAEDPLRLITGPPPSPEIVNAELVGNYAIRFSWADGHENGIYGFSSLRASCPCEACNDRELDTLVQT